ncbi:uncharacterized protein LOC117896636 [Drosophila subobscura]|uniref:uncharacterized protein LOC117896636 n=1 Tax=Drosophila subobscura TaxID=7241 RepID=UPI00155A6CAC|nr:uncharacterized protein LOC117896636 [Drosophila subobscura]
MRFGNVLFLSLCPLLLLLLVSSVAGNRRHHRLHRSARARSYANPFVAIEYYAEPRITLRRTDAEKAAVKPNSTDYDMFWEEKTLLRHRHLSLVGNQQPATAFFANCQNIFKEKDFAAHVVKGILDAITKRLEQLCADKKLHPLYPRMLAGNLYCSSSIQDTMDMLLDLLLDQVERNCDQIAGFQSIYIFTK